MMFGRRFLFWTESSLIAGISIFVIKTKFDVMTLKNRLLCQESGHKSTNKFDFQFKLLNLIFGGRSFSPVQILKTL